MRIGNREFDVQQHTYIMGILNVTPDSFFDGGRYTGSDEMRERVRSMVEEGCDLIDVGGESTRPGFAEVSVEEEIRRTCPVIEWITSEYDIPVSIDTRKSRVAEAALKAGASLINDVTGLAGDDEMADLAARTGVACVIMSDCAFRPQEDIIKAVLSDWENKVGRALDAGVLPGKIILDPGIGFHAPVDPSDSTGRNAADRIIVDRMEELKKAGFPLLIAHSNKSFLKKEHEKSKAERLPGTVLVTGMAAGIGASFVRVHDIGVNKAAIRIAETIRKQGERS